MLEGVAVEEVPSLREVEVQQPLEVELPLPEVWRASRLQSRNHHLTFSFFVFPCLFNKLYI